jgi:hypothetical protein
MSLENSPVRGFVARAYGYPERLITKEHEIE